MVCKFCNNNLEEKTNFCPKCGTRVDDLNTNFISNNTTNYIDFEKEKKLANKLCLLSLLFVLSPVLIWLFTGIIVNTFKIKLPENNIFMKVFGVISSNLLLIGVVLMAYVRIKFPKNIFGKVLGVVYFLVQILFTLIPIVFSIFFILALFACVSGLGS